MMSNMHCNDGHLNSHLLCQAPCI